MLTDRSPLTEGRDFSVVSPRSWRLADLGAKHMLLRQGLGWGNMPRHLVADDLASGRLVRPFDLSLKGPAQFAYFLIRPDSAAEPPLVTAFRDWILAEAAQMKKTDGARRTGKPLA